MLTSSSAFALNKSLTGLLIPFNRQMVREVYGDRLDPGAAEDFAAYLTGGWGAFVNTWVVEGPAPLDAEEFTDRLMRMMSILAGPYRSTISSAQEDQR
jgi:hypothetical protein